jgi:hypothetical protein
MNMNKFLMAVAAVGLMAGTSGALAQEPAHKTAMEQVPPKTFDTSPANQGRISEIFGKESSARKLNHVSFRLAPGTVVPRSVRLVALPKTIIDIEPTWRGNEYFMVRGQIVIVNPKSMKIVGVLKA